VSLIVAAHNQDHIVIGSESLSTYTKDGKHHVPEDGEVVKVTLANPQLALMLTGKYMSDKRAFVRRFQAVARNIANLDEAFDRFYDMALHNMTIHPGEGFMMGLAGFTIDGPSFRLIIQEHGQEMGYVKDYPYNYYLSGEDDAAKYAEAQLKERGIPAQPPADEIEMATRTIIEECIERYPQKLGGPVVITTLVSVV
jgi:hypothetical protein